MDVYEIRRENLRRLMAERYSSKQAMLASAIGKPPNYVSFIFTKRKNVGEALAREIEAKLGLPTYTLDQEPGAPRKRGANYAQKVESTAVELAEKIASYSASGRLHPSELAIINNMVDALAGKPPTKAG